jgi:hypothetical protein
MLLEPQLAQALSTIVLPKYNVEFYFGFFAFVFSILVAGYYIIDWEHYHSKQAGHVTLLWGIGSFLSFWFAIPFLIANAGLPVVVTDYHPLFSVMIPLAFLGTLLIYRGIRSLSNPGGKQLDLGLAVWFFASAIYFGYFFFHLEVVASYAAMIFGVAVFFMVLFAAMLISLVAWYKRIDLHQFPYTGIGIVLFSGATLLQLASCVAALFSIMRLPPQLWFAALMATATPYVLQSVSVLMLTCGQYYLHHEQAPHPTFSFFKRDSQ